MRVGTVAVLASIQLGCGGAFTLIVKPPVVSRCEETGLKGCDEITDGVLLWADGKKEEARTKLRAGIAKNSTTRVRKYAANLKIVASMPGISDYSAPIIEVCDLLADETGGPLTAEEEKTAEKPSAKPAKEKSEGDVTAARDTAKDHALRTSTAVPFANSQAYSCQPFSSLASPVGPASCLRVSEGPLIITDIHVSAGCPNDMFFLVGKIPKPRWFVLAPPGGTSLHGARLLVNADESVIVGVRAGSADQELKKDVACSVTWAAVEP